MEWMNCKFFYSFNKDLITLKCDNGKNAGG